jgi:two-component system, cell cycle response regulator
MLLLITSGPAPRSVSRLRAWGYDVVHASSPVAAESACRDLVPAVILLDCASLGSAAVTLGARLRPQFPWPRTLVLLLVTRAREAGVASRVAAARADGYLSSPLSREALDTRLATHQRTVELEAELSAMRDHLRFAATHDGLTGAWNKPALLGHLYREVVRAVREGRPLSVALCDIDYFKRVNDRYGHKAGDDVLRAVVQRMRSSLRPYDIVGRLGGDELGVLLTGVDAEEAALIAGRMARAVADTAVAVDGTGVQVTLSVGIAGLDASHEGKAPDALLDAADRALYRAKAAGRARVVVS